MVISLSGPAGRIAVMLVSLATAIEIALVTIQVLNSVDDRALEVCQKTKHAIPIHVMVCSSI